MSTSPEQLGTNGASDKQAEPGRWYEAPEFGYYPALIQLGLTYRCNLECPHCYALYRRTRTELSAAEVKRLIDESVDLGSCKLVYSHGENLIRSDFHEIASYVASKGFFQTLMTNGFYLRKPEQVQRLADAGINKVMVSIDSSEAEEHNLNRGQATAYDTAVSAIGRLKESTALRVGVSMAIDTRNYKRIREVVELAAGWGVDFVSLMQVRPNKPHTFKAYDWSSYEAVCRDLYELILEYRGRVEIYSHDPFMITLMDVRLDNQREREEFVAHNQCNVGKYMMSICPDGEVTGCNFIERSVGNLRQAPLAVIWERLMREYDDAHLREGPCVGCKNLGTCRTGCKAFHLPYESRFDKRCNEHPFNASEIVPAVSQS